MKTRAEIIKMIEELQPDVEPQAQETGSGKALYKDGKMISKPAAKPGEF